MTRISGMIKWMGDIKRQEKILKALANKRRLKILEYVRKNKEATVGELAEYLKISFPATSKHLGLLFSADILDREQKSLLVYYRLSDPAANDIRKTMEALY